MSNQYDDQQDSANQDFVNKHYQTLPKAVPTDAIDAAILLKARQQAIGIHQTHAPSISMWRKWQYGGSIAASILVVVIVFIVAQPTLNEGSKRLADASSAIEAPLGSVELIETRAPEFTSQATEQIVVTGARILESDMDDDAETEMLIIEAASDMTLETGIGTNAGEAENMLAQQAKEKTAHLLVLDGLLAQLLEIQPEQPEIGFSKDGLAKNSMSAPKKQTDVAEPTANLPAISDVTAREYDHLQTQLFALLMADKLSDKNWVLEDRYATVLTLEQIKQLSAGDYGTQHND